MAFRHSYYMARGIAKSNICHTFKSNTVESIFYAQNSSELRLAQSGS